MNPKLQRIKRNEVKKFENQIALFAQNTFTKQKHWTYPSCKTMFLTINSHLYLTMATCFLAILLGPFSRAPSPFLDSVAPFCLFQVFTWCCCSCTILRIWIQALTSSAEVIPVRPIQNKTASCQSYKCCTQKGFNFLNKNWKKILTGCCYSMPLRPSCSWRYCFHHHSTCRWPTEDFRILTYYRWWWSSDLPLQQLCRHWKLLWWWGQELWQQCHLPKVSCSWIHRQMAQHCCSKR